MAGATEDLVAGADLLIVGGPTHMHGLSSATTRRMAAQAAAKQASGLSLDPDTCGPGLRDWLKGIGDGHALAAAFAVFSARRSWREARGLSPGRDGRRYQACHRPGHPGPWSHAHDEGRTVLSRLALPCPGLAVMRLR